MYKNNYNVIGVMSGTSLDGIDLAYVSFSFNKKWQFKILVAETVAYSEIWFQKLKTLVSLKRENLNLLDNDYTKYLSETINEFIDRHGLIDIDAVCSHGHTALHQPQSGLTYQMGNLPKIASFIKQKVVCDFRVEDVELGGQGAPLVPIGDELLFSEYDFCLNLGGFANISTTTKNERIAYDICPVNIVLNHYMSQLDLAFDNKGQMASKGEINQNLLEQLNSLEFYQQKPPKSLGLEWVNSLIFPLINSNEMALEDLLRTFVEHISITIANEINKKENALVLVTGGGTYNDFLMERLTFHSNNSIEIPVRKIIEYKEALIFGLIGVLKLRGEVNCLRSVTGASRNHSSGKIYCP